MNRREAIELGLLSVFAIPGSLLQERTIDRIVETARRQHRIPGLAAALITTSTSLAVSGYRRAGREENIRASDCFHIASCTKSWTALLAAMAVHRGQLQWESEVGDVLPELLPSARPEYLAATVEQLLAHEAHFPAYTQPSESRVHQLHSLTGTAVEQRLAFLEQALSEPPNRASGEEGYSNVGYAAVGAILERVTALSWERLILRDIAAPLKLTNVGFGYPATLRRPDEPRGHARVSGELRELRLGERELPICLWPAGAIHCSVRDLSVYVRDQLDGLRNRDALLPPSFYQRLHRQRGSVFTLGWGITSDPELGTVHFGAGSGGWFFARIQIVPARNIAVVVLANSGDAGVATREVARSLLS